MTKKNKKQQPPPRRCIFCNLPGKLTRQHIFSDFLRHYIARNNQGSTHLRSDTGFGPAISSTPNFTSKKDQGDMGVKKLLLVCEICNSGWISENENNIKEIIGKLVLGELIGLEDNLIPKIAAWIAVMTIMGEFMEPDERAIHRNHRNFIYKNRYPSDGWKIWIGIYEGEQTQLYRWSHIIQSDNPQDVTNPTFSPIDHPDHCQVTVITLGKLLIVSATNPAVDIDGMFTEMIYTSKHRLVQLWPRNKATDFSKTWPPEKTSNDLDVLNLSNSLPNIIHFLKQTSPNYQIIGDVK